MPIAVGPFELDHPIGRGGMGEVWRGVHRAQALPVALKVLTAEMAREKRYLLAFRNEVRRVAGLSHPNVVIVYDAGVIDAGAAEASGGALVEGSPWLAMELARGELMGPLPWDSARPILADLLRALAHAHARGVVHRDLKPGNVLVTDAGPKLTDFGLASAVQEADWAARTAAAGTPAFMAPEQATGRWRDFGPWTDLYAFGRLVLDLLTGSPEGAAHRVALRPGLPRTLARWLERLLAPRISDRFRQASDALWALEHLDDELVPGGSTVTGALVEATRVTDDQVTWLADGEAADAAEAPRTDPLVVPPMPADWRSHPSVAAGVSPATALAGVGLGLYGLRSIPLVDREAARDRLWQALSDVRGDGRPRMVVLRGGAGFGKSRLAAWLTERAHELGAGHAATAAHAPEPAPSDGLGPLVGRLLRADKLDRQALVRRVERLLLGLGSADPGDAEALAELIAPSGAPDDPRGSAAERHALVERLLAKVGADRPVICVLEDVQWGADALAFARRLMARNAAPVLLVLTVGDEHLARRPGEARLLAQAVAAGAGRAAEIAVGPLLRDDRRALVRGLLGLDGDLAVRVEDRTAGNPLFAVQLVGDWVQRGLLVPGARGFALRDGARVDLPDDLNAVWAGHVSRVLGDSSPEEAASIELAAILGVEVDAGEWEAACAVAGLEPAWDVVERLLGQRLARSAEGPRVRFELVHTMLREALERRASEGGRSVDLHLACASMLRARSGAADRLARHLLAAGRTEEALDPLLDAATRALMLGDFVRSGALLRERDAALRSLGLPPEDPRRLDQAVNEGRLARAEGRVEDADRLFGAAVAAYRRTGRAEGLSGALAEWAHLLSDRGEAARAWACAEEALALALPLPDPAVRARARWAVGRLLAEREESLAAMEVYLAAQADFEAWGKPLSAARCRRAIGRCLTELGNLDEAATMYEQALADEERLGSRSGVAACLADLGFVAAHREDWATAEQRYRQAEQAWSALGGNSPNRIDARYNVVWVVLKGRGGAAAKPLVDEALRDLVPRDRPGTWAAFHWLGAAAAADLRDWSAFDAHVAQAELELPRWADPTIAHIAGLTAQRAEAAGDAARAQAARAVSRAHQEALDALGQPETVR
jgi:tetratricopeptide (TPR) repeat protein